MQDRPYTSVYDEERRVLAVSGSVDESTAALFRQDILAATDRCSDGVVVDLSDVDYFPSAAVSVVVSTTRPVDGVPRGVALLAEQGSVAQRVLRMCGLPHRTT